jgi:signal peptidase I
MVTDMKFDMIKRAGGPRKTWVAVVLSLLMPGLGQVYNGQFQKGLVFFLLTTLGGLAITLFTLTLPIVLLGLLLLLNILILVLTIVDAVKTARQHRYSFQPQKYNRPLVYLTLYLVFGLLGELAVSGYIKQNHVQTYNIPTGSMETTLHVGDHILVDKTVETVSRGDIVVFKLLSDLDKDNPRDFVKRVVGMPGDIIEMRDKQLLVNDQPVQEDYVINRDSRTLHAGSSSRDNMAPLTVPQGMYFVMGDNRDYSYDSRFWGFVAADKVVGWAVKIYWSWDGNNSAARWERIGRQVY